MKTSVVYRILNSGAVERAEQKKKTIKNRKCSVDNLQTVRR